jgi:hypothetical protein
MPRNAWFKPPSVSQFLLAFLIAPLFLIQAFAQSQPPIFPTTSFYPLPAGQFPFGMATGDFNGDGKSDLVYLSIPSSSSGGVPSGTVTVLLNQGPTTPPIPVATNSLNCEPQGSLVAADINNDKKLDLVVSCQSGYVVVLLGNGDGSFQAPAFYAIPSPAALVTVDLNGDGYLDVVGLISPSLPAAPTLFVLLNKGQSSPGNLSNPTNYSLPSLAFTIGTGDFNGDEKQDILIGSSSSAGTVGNSQLSVYYGNGDGTLQTAQALPGVPSYNIGSGFFTADYNHDGFTDIAYIVSDPTNVQPPSLRTLLGSSTGQFTSGSSLTLDRSETGALLSAGTLSGGNKINLAIVASSTTIVLGDGNGGFTLGQSYPLAGGAVSEVDANGRTNLIFQSDYSLTLLAGNGDGTFQGIPTSPIGQYITTADFNGDGLTDVLSLDIQGDLVTELSRGNGTFTLANRIASVAVPLTAGLVTGDFNADGKVDAAVVLPGNGSPNSQVYLYQGNGDGTFRTGSSPIDLQVIAATQAVVGDFNGDGKLDLVISCAGLYPRQPAGNALVFLPGRGDGTFGAPVPFAPQSSLNSSILPLFFADLNNDGKLDLIWNSAVFLGNGDGSFQQRPLGLTGSPVALSDLNGDGIPDLVIGSGIYAGNGDGTFQNSPFFTVPTQFGYSIASAAIGDVNADGHIDLLLRYAPSNSFGDANVHVFYGNGKGNYTADSNTYYTGSPSSGGLFGGTPSSAVLARLNNQAPARPNDTTLDYLSLYGTATSLLNQLNPAPISPPPTAKTVLTSSLSNPLPTQQLTLTATVTGVSPTGTVTFLSGTTTLGSASLVNGVATLAVPFPSASIYTVTATYAGDPNNAPSTSNAISIAVAPIASTTKLSTVPSFFANENQQISLVATVTGFNPTGTVTFTTATATLGTANLTSGTATLPFAFTAPGTYAITAKYSGDIDNLTSASNTVTVTVAAPDYTVTATPASATVTAGQSATTQINVFPVGGYTGTVKLSCGTLPTGVTCIFGSPQLGILLPAAAFTTLNVTTTATTTAHLQPFSIPLAGTAWAALICLALSPRRTLRLKGRLLDASLLALLLAIGLIQLSGCSSSSPSPSPSNTGTPKGTQTITITAADGAGGLSNTIPLQITVQ